MKLLSLSFKNIIFNWWRSLTLGTFILIVSFLLVFFNSFILTVKNNLENSLINALTGSVQIRSAQTKENDMLSMSGSWEEMSYIDSEHVEKMETVFNQLSLNYNKRVRYNAMLISNTEKINSMIIGLDLKSEVYQKSIQLFEGRYLNPQGTHEIVLTKTQADKLQVKVGDKLGVITQNRDGYTTDSALTVVGIGAIDLLSRFGFSSIGYTDLASAQELVGFQLDEVSDIIIYVSNKKEVNHVERLLNSQLQKAGINKIKITTWENMGGYIQGIVNVFVMVFYGFIGILLIIVSILIINLIIMMGLERRQEIGMLRAIGFSRFTIIRIFMNEILLITIIFGTLGVIAGSALVLIFSNTAINAGPTWDFVLGNRFQMHFDIAQIIPIGIILLGFTFVAAFYPLFKAASLSPVETLKEM